MKDNQTGRTNIAMILLAAVLLTALAMAGACSKKEPSDAHKAAAAPKGETEEKGEHQEGGVKLTPEGVKTAGIEVQEVVAAARSELVGATGVVELNGDRVSRVNPRVTGRCIKVNASLGDRVGSGQTLAQIDSVEVDQAWSDYLKARAKLDLATRSVRREETLFQKKVSPEKDLLKARQELGEAEADMLLVSEKFRLLGIDVGQVESNTNGTKHNLRSSPSRPPCRELLWKRR